MGEDYWEFEPTHLIQTPTNYKAIVRAPESDPIWERLHLVPWLVHIPRAERDKTLPERLRNDPGVLRAIVEGCVDYCHRGGLEPPKTVTDALEEYREESDTLGRFLSDCCDVSDTAWTASKVLYTVYKDWCGVQGIHALSQINLTGALNESNIGSELRKHKEGRGRQGIAIKKPKSTDPIDEVEDLDAELGDDAVGLDDDFAPCEGI